jgi:hypothetical protein
MTTVEGDVVASPPLPPGRRLALVIANSRYRNAEYPDLQAPAQDAKLMTQLLGDLDVCGFEVETLLDETSDGIRRAMNKFYSGRHRDEFILVYYSGHGVKDDGGRLHLVAADTDPTMLPATGVSARYLLDLSSATPVSRQLIVLDCCYSGAYDAKGTETLGLLDLVTSDRPAHEASARGRCIITASRGAEYSYQRRLPTGEVTGSILTVALAEGIRSGEADLANNGRITVQDAYRYAYAAVTQYDRRQNPQFNMYGGEGASIVLARNPAGIRVGGEGVYELFTALDSQHAKMRDAAVRTLGEMLRDDNPAKAAAARRRLQTLAEDEDDALAPAARQLLNEAKPKGKFTAWRDRVRSVRLPAEEPQPRAASRYATLHDDDETLQFTDAALDGGSLINPPQDGEGLLLPGDSELDELQPTEDPLGVFGRRVLPLEDEPSSVVVRYLFPTERFRGDWHRHWADPAMAAIVAGWCAGRAQLSEPQRLPFLPAPPTHLFGMPTVGLARWCLILVALVAVYRMLSWIVWRMALTNTQIMVVTGLLRRRTTTIPLDRMTRFGMSQSPLGRALSYGTFWFHTGTWRTYRIRFVPNPNELWLRLVEEKFAPSAVEARLAPSSDDDE